MADSNEGGMVADDELPYDRDYSQTYFSGEDGFGLDWVNPIAYWTDVFTPENGNTGAAVVQPSPVNLAVSHTVGNNTSTPVPNTAIQQYQTGSTDGHYAPSSLPTIASLQAASKSAINPMLMVGGGLALVGLAYWLYTKKAAQ